MIDAASDGSINNKNLDEAYELMKLQSGCNYEAYELLRKYASNNYSDWCAQKKTAGVFEVDQTTAFSFQMSSIQQQLS